MSPPEFSDYQCGYRDALMKFGHIMDYKAHEGMGLATSTLAADPASLVLASQYKIGAEVLHMMASIALQQADIPDSDPHASMEYM